MAKTDKRSSKNSMPEGKDQFVWDFLKGIGVDTINILDAVDDDHFEETYQLILDNPDITKEEFLNIMGFEDESIESERRGIICKEAKYLSSIGFVWMEVVVAADDDNWDIIQRLLQEKPQISRTEFLHRIGIDDIDAFNKECRDYFGV